MIHNNSNIVYNYVVYALLYAQLVILYYCIEITIHASNITGTTCMYSVYGSVPVSPDVPCEII